jgi:hypothetical protein
MTGATHLLAGTAAYILLRGNKILAPVVAIGSHFILDAIPHFDNMAWNIPMGFLAILFILYITWRQRDIFIVINAFFGFLPDANCYFRWSEIMFEIHKLSHFTKTGDIPIHLLYIEIYTSLAYCYLVITRYLPTDENHSLNRGRSLVQRINSVFAGFNRKPEIEQ